MCSQKVIISVLLLLISINIFAKETLIFAVDVVRHGDRTPYLVIPKGTHKWVEGMSQLTARGMQQEFQLGVSLRKKYVHKYHLLPKSYQTGTIHVSSTETDRTLMSVQSLLLGLYPLGTGPSLPDGKPALPNFYQPIPIYTRPDFDKTKYYQLAAQYITSKAKWKEKILKLKNRLQKWSLATGLNIGGFDISLLIALGDALHIHRLYRASMPPELSEKDIKDIIAIGNWGHLTQFQTKEIANFFGRSLLTSIVGYLQKAGLQEDPLKYVLFSDHDITIESIMTILQNPLKELPPYVANLNFMLFKTDAKNYLVKISYNGKPIIIPSCGTKICTLQQFVKLAEVKPQEKVPPVSKFLKMLLGKYRKHTDQVLK